MKSFLQPNIGLNSQYKVLTWANLQQFQQKILVNLSCNHQCTIFNQTLPIHHCNSNISTCWHEKIAQCPFCCVQIFQQLVSCQVLILTGENNLALFIQYNYVYTQVMPHLLLSGVGQTPITATLSLNLINQLPYQLKEWRQAYEHGAAGGSTMLVHGIVKF